MCQSVTSSNTKLPIHFMSLSRKTSSLLGLLVMTMLVTSSLSLVRTYDRVCIDNESFSKDTFLTQANPQRINYNLFRGVNRRGSIIPSVIKMNIDSTVGTYNHSIDYCPWSDPMPLAATREDTTLSRDVCYTMKIGARQIQNAFSLNVNSSKEASETQTQRDENLDEIVRELKEFNFGNCMADMNPLLFSNYDQMLYTVTEFKYSASDLRHKYNHVTPQNFYFLREKLHGTVRDIVNKKLHFEDESDPTWHDIVMFQMARAVNMVHLRGWTHRDVKNENFAVKKTVDKRIEVRLGEFMFSRMKSTHQRIADKEDDTHGGPFYIPLDAKDHPDDMGNDLYALGLSMIELITHRSVEDVVVAVSAKQNPDKPLNLAVFDHSEVETIDKLETKMDLDFSPLFEGIQLDNVLESQSIVEVRKKEIVQTQIEKSKTSTKSETKQDLDFADFNFTSENMFSIESINFGEGSIITPMNIDLGNNDYRNLSAKRNLNSSNSRILTNKESDYGGLEISTFQIDSPGNYGELNFNPESDLKLNTLVQESEEITDLQVHESFQILNKELSLPSVEDFTLPDQVVKFEQNLEVQMMSSPNNLLLEDEKEPAKAATTQANYNAQKTADDLIRNMASGSYYNRFINLAIFKGDHNNELAQAVSDKKNAQANALCMSELNDYKKAGGKYANSFAQGLTTLECLMVFLARSLVQNDQLSYFKLLDAEMEMGSMNDVFEMIGYDRSVSHAEASKMKSFDQYISNKIVLV